MDNKENEDINNENIKSVEDVVSDMVDEANQDLDMFKEVVIDDYHKAPEEPKDTEYKVAEVSEDDEEDDYTPDEEEINRAMEVVSTSKRKRAKKEKKPRIYYSDVKGQEITDDMFRRFSFIDKCRKDPVIPICILIIIAIIAGAVLYYVIPMFGNKTFGFTLKHYNDRFVTTQMYADAMRTWNYEVVDTHYQMSGLSNSSASEANGDTLLDLSQMLDKTGVKYFDSNIKSTYDADLIGCVSPLNDEIVYMRAMAKFEDVSENPHFVTYYFASVLQTIFPALGSQDAIDVASEMLSGYSGSKEYTLMGTVACRVVMGTYNGTNYVAMDLTPKENVGL